MLKSGLVHLNLMRPPQTMNVNLWLLLIVLSALWGGSFFFFKILVAELPPLTIVMARVVIAALALLIFLRFSGQPLPRDARAWRAFFIMALLNNIIPFTLIVWAEIHITSGLASVLNATSPVFSALLAHFFADNERLKANRIAGILLSLLGVALLIGPGSLRGFSLKSLAQLGVLASALSYACAAIYARAFQAMRIPPVAVSAGQLTAAAIVMIPLALAFDRPWAFAHAPSFGAVSALLALGLLSTAFAYILYFRILASAGATNALSATFLVPVSALLLGAMVLKEQLTLLELAGMLAILVGLVMLDGRIFQVFKRREPYPA